MAQQPDSEPVPGGRWGWASTVLLFSLWLISASAGNGDWASVALLALLDVAVIAVAVWADRR